MCRIQILQMLFLVPQHPLASLQVMPTKDSFDAVMYLAIMHGDTALVDLKLGHQNLNFEATERTGQLKSLVCCPAHPYLGVMFGWS